MLNVFFDESQVNRRRRDVYIDRIRNAISRIGIIDGCNATKLADDLVESFDFALRHHLAEWSRVELKPYLGVGNQDWLRVRGRVAERSKVSLPQPDEEPFDVLVSCWYRFLISQQSVIPVLAQRGDREVVGSTDDEGFFDLVISSQAELGDTDIFSVEIEVGAEATIRAEREVCRVLVPSPEAQVCVLVDLDGLVLSQPQSRFAQVLAEIILGTREKLHPESFGAEMFLRRLAIGNSAPNPIFYLSNAPRHLYKHLTLAREYAGLPEGYLHLRDFDMRLRSMDTDHLDVLEMLLAHDLIDNFPNHDFVFVGAASRSTFYEPLLKALCHRLSGVYMLGASGTPQSLLDLNEELQLPILTAHGERLLMHSIEQGWTDA